MFSEVVDDVELWFNPSQQYLMCITRTSAFYTYAKAKAQISCTVTVHLCFSYTDITIPLLPKSEILSL